VVDKANQIAQNKIDQMEEKQRQKDQKAEEHIKQMKHHSSQKVLSRRTIGSVQQIRAQEKIKAQMDQQRKHSMFKSKQIQLQI